MRVANDRLEDIAVDVPLRYLIPETMKAMDYFEYPQTQLVPSGVTTGSMNVEYEPKLVMSHAVAREEDGTFRAKTECGRPAYFGPDRAEPQTWDQAHPYLRCQKRVETAGGELRNGKTGERVMPPV